MNRQSYEAEIHLLMDRPLCETVARAVRTANGIKNASQAGRLFRLSKPSNEKCIVMPIAQFWGYNAGLVGLHEKSFADDFRMLIEGEGRREGSCRIPTFPPGVLWVSRFVGYLDRVVKWASRSTAIEFFDPVMAEPVQECPEFSVDISFYAIINDAEKALNAADAAGLDLITFLSRRAGFGYTKKIGSHSFEVGAWDGRKVQ